MFHLEQAIAAWRRRLAAGGITTPGILDELENHLRDDVEQQMREGASPQDAFNAAVERIGETDALKAEFSKIGRRRVFFSFLLKAFVLSSLTWLILRLGAESIFKGKWSLAADIIVGSAIVALLLLYGWARKSALLRAPALPTSAPLARALELAQGEAFAFKHDFVGTEHALLGLIQERSAFVPKVLEKLGATPDAIRREIADLVGPGSSRPAVHPLPHTPRLKKAFDLAAREAKFTGQSYIKPEHLLLGLSLAGEGVAALVLEKLDIKIEDLRAEITRITREPDPPSDLSPEQ